MLVRRSHKHHRSHKTKVSDASLGYFAKVIQVADNSYTPEKLPLNKWELIEKVYIPEKDAQALIVKAKDEDLIVVGIRGTIISSWTNIKTDLSAGFSDYTYCNGCKVHTGFYLHHKAMIAKLDIALVKALDKQPNAKIIITGHSLGGAIATLYIGHLINRYAGKYDARLELVTFGSPRVGNKAFADYINRVVGVNKIYRVAYQLDPITFVPLLMMGYYHVGDKKYVFDDFKKFTVYAGADIDTLSPWDLTKINNHRQYGSIRTARFYRRALRRMLRRRFSEI